MKKYVKPELFYESFELTQQIAACDYDSQETHNGGTGACRFTGVHPEWGLVSIFLDNCGKDDSVNVIDYGYCYHNSTSSPLGIFNS